MEDGGGCPSRFHLTAVPQQSHWSSAKQADDSIVTQVATRLLVKNRTPDPLALVRSRLVSPKIRGEIVHDDVSVRSVDENIYGTAHSGYVVPPGMSLPASALIMIRGVPRRKLGKQVRATIGVTDDEGHEQKVVVDMLVLSPSVEGLAMPSLETVSSISNPIEREVVSVLQAELGRYDKCGRRVGGLGSIHLVVNGREITGVGNDSWNPNSPRNQSISESPEICELKSDNLEALMAYYGRLTTAQEQGQFAEALLSRMDGKSLFARHVFYCVRALENWKAAGSPRKGKSTTPARRN